MGEAFDFEKRDATNATNFEIDRPATSSGARNEVKLCSTGRHDKRLLNRSRRGIVQ